MVSEARCDRIHSKAIPDLIVKLLAERQEVLVLFNRLVGVKPYILIASVQPLLQRFCQVLVDYMALGHFEVFECVESSTKSTTYPHVKRLAKELYPRIAETTQTALDFNDHYADKDCSKTLDELRMDLSHLGEQLAARIELEDRLIVAVKSSTPEPIQ